MIDVGTGAGRDWREVLESYPCATCGAGPGDPCRTYNGHHKTEHHAPRTRAAHDNQWRFAEDDEAETPPR